MSRRIVSSTALGMLAFAGIAVALALGPASSSAPAATSGPVVPAPKGVDPLQAWQRFVACMSKGTGLRVSLMPPPRYGVRIGGLARNSTPAQQAAFDANVRAANARCHRYLTPIQKSSNSSQDEARFRDQALALARCLRRHGVDVGDPIIRKVAGGFDLSWPPTSGVAVGGRRWHAALDACRAVNPIVNGK
jgi:hypothetical protein